MRVANFSVWSSSCLLLEGIAVFQLVKLVFTKVNLLSFINETCSSRNSQIFYMQTYIQPNAFPKMLRKIQNSVLHNLNKILLIRLNFRANNGMGNLTDITFWVTVLIKKEKWLVLVKVRATCNCMFGKYRLFYEFAFLRQKLNWHTKFLIKKMCVLLVLYLHLAK